MGADDDGAAARRLATSAGGLAGGVGGFFVWSGTGLGVLGDGVAAGVAVGEAAGRVGGGGEARRVVAAAAAFDGDDVPGIVPSCGIGDGDGDLLNAEKPAAAAARSSSFKAR